MKKVHVFNAGPCLLPQVAIDNAIEALKDFKGTGVSVLSISHRTKEWDATMDECRALWRELLNIPETHEIVFLGGGASLQFLYVAMNYLEKKAAYLETGVWAKKALKEAKGIGFHIDAILHFVWRKEKVVSIDCYELYEGIEKIADKIQSVAKKEKELVKDN